MAPADPVADVAPPAGFALTVPHDWYEIDLRPTTREASIKALVHERVPRGSALHDAKPAIVELLTNYSVQAWESGATYCACFAQPTDEGPITGSVSVLVVDPPMRGTPTVDAVLDALEATNPPEPPTVVDIEGVGQVARLYGVQDVDLPDGTLSRSIVMQTFIPIPGTSRFALVSAGSPVLWMEEVLLDVFDAVTSTFRFVEAG